MAGRRRQEQDPVTTVVYFLVGVAIYGGIIKKWAYVILGSLAAFVVLFIPILKNFLEEQRLNQAGMPEIDKMTGREFERWLTNFFRAKGYRVELTPGQGDWGADLILVGPQGRTAIQAKRWNGNVGVSAIQEVVAAKAHYDCDHAWVVTNSRYTEAARKLARSNQVELWDRDKLVAEILSLSNQKTLAKAK